MLAQRKRMQRFAFAWASQSGGRKAPETCAKTPLLANIIYYLRLLSSGAHEALQLVPHLRSLDGSNRPPAKLQAVLGSAPCQRAICARTTMVRRGSPIWMQACQSVLAPRGGAQTEGGRAPAPRAHSGGVRAPAPSGASPPRDGSALPRAVYALPMRPQQRLSPRQWPPAADQQLELLALFHWCVAALCNFPARRCRLCSNPGPIFELFWSHWRVHCRHG